MAPKHLLCDRPGDVNIILGDVFLTFVQSLQDGIFGLFEGISDQQQDWIRE